MTSESLFRCNVCKKDAFLRCNGCGVAHYCSIECQTVDRASHKRVCGADALVETLDKIETTLMRVSDVAEAVGVEDDEHERPPKVSF
jgi:hypothetical protein